METIHSYCGRGTAEGQIDICSGGFKVSDLRHSKDTMAQLVKRLFLKKEKMNHKHHTPPLKVTHPTKKQNKKKVLHKVIHSCNKNRKTIRPVLHPCEFKKSNKKLTCELHDRKIAIF